MMSLTRLAALAGSAGMLATLYFALAGHDGPASPGAGAAAVAAEAEPVNGSAPLLPPVSLTLRGGVADLPEGARIDSVTVEVGGTTVSAAVNGHAYSAALHPAAPGDVVAVNAVAGSVRYRAIAGTVAQLARLSPADPVVTASEASALVVDSLSTAHAVVVRAWLGGRDARDDEEYERALLHVQGGDLGSIGYLLDAYARGALPLPAGHASGLDVVRSPAALQAALDALPAGDPIGAYLRARELRAPLGAAQLPDKLLLRGATVADLPSVNAGASLLLREGEGRYAYVDQDPVSDTAARLEAGAGGELVLTPAFVRTQVSYPSRPDLGGPNSQVKQVQMLDSIELRRIADRDRVDSWVVSYHWIRSFPDFPAVPPERVTGTGLIASVDLGAATRREAWAGIEGRRRTFPTLCGPTQAGRPTVEICDTALHRFDPGGSGFTEDVGYKVDERMQPRAGAYGSAFSWTREADGALVLSDGDSTLRAWSTHGVPGIDSAVYVASHVRDGARWTLAGTTLSIDATTVPFGPAQAVGGWGLGLVLSTPFEYLPSGTSTELLRYSTGLGEQVDRHPDGESRIVQAWAVMGERLYETRSRARFPNGSTRYVANCTQAAAEGATHCSPWRIRYLRPLRRVGNRVYGIEELHMQLETQPIGYTGTYDVTVSTRANYQECLSGDCRAYAAAGPSPQADTAPPASGQRARVREDRRREITGRARR